MSLINKMLGELKKQRNAEAQNQQAEIATIYTSPNPPKNKTLINLASIAFIIAFVLGVIWYIYYATHKTVTSRVLNLAIPLTQTEKKPQPEQNVKPILTNLESYNVSTTSDNKTLLNFMLSAKAIFTIDRSLDHREISINLSNTTINNPIPVVELDKNIIESLNTGQSNTDTQIHLRLANNVQTDSIEYISTPQPEIQVTLSSLEPFVPKMTKVTVPVAPEVDADKRYQDALNLISQNQTQSAMERLFLLLGDFPNHVAARELLAQLLIRNNKLQPAKDILDIGLKKYPGYVPFVKLKAYIYAKKGNPALAIDLLESNKPADITEDPDYYTLLANMYQQQGKNNLAAEIYYKLAKIQPDNAAFWVGLGTALDAANKHNAAIEAYQKALDTGNLPIELRDFVLTKLKNN